MKAKKIVALLLASGMALSLLAGCGEKTDDKQSASNSKEESKSEVKESESEVESEEESKGITFPLEEPVTITAFMGTYKTAPGDLTFFKEMEKLTNVHFEFTTAQIWGEDTEKVNLLLSSDTYPEVIFGMFDALTSQKYGQEGLFIPLQDLMAEYSPNYMALAEERPEIWQLSADQEGNVYSYCFVAAPGSADDYLYINRQWLENLDLEMPETPEQFLDVLRAFRDEDANGDGDKDNEIPYIAHGEGGAWEQIGQYLGIRMGGNMEHAISEDGSDLYYYPADSKWKDTLAFVATMYEEKLMNQDWVSLTVDQMTALGNSGTPIGSSEYVIPWLVGADEPGSLCAQYDSIPFFNGNPDQAILSCSPGKLVITDKCEHPEIMAAWIDMAYDQAEISQMATMGLEGIQYTLTEDGSMWQKTDYRKTTGDDSMVPGYDGPMYQHPFYGGGWYIVEDETPYTYRDIQLSKKYIETGNVYSIPAVSFTAEENEIMADIYADIKPYVAQFAAGVICGKIDLEAEWDNYIAELKNMGLDEMEEIWDTAYARSK